MPDPALDYTRPVAACRNSCEAPFPLYEHDVAVNVVESLSGRELVSLAKGDEDDRAEFFRIYAGTLASQGYDTVPSEGCVTELIQGTEGLCGRAGALLKDRKDVEAFDWDGIPEAYFRRFSPSFRALGRSLPAGMKAHGDVGNGVFETIQDFVPLVDIAYLQVDGPKGWELLVRRMDDLLVAILGPLPPGVRRDLRPLPLRRRPWFSEFHPHPAVGNHRPHPAPVSADHQPGEGDWEALPASLLRRHRHGDGGDYRLGLG